MNWFGFHSLSSLWLLLLVPPLVLFYFLKLRRPRQRVPSLFLWQQVLLDQRVNSPFQRFKRNLLLFIQLLLLLLVILAALQPFWRGRPSRMVRLPILIDCSASMGALDQAGGTSRLAAAKERVARLIDEKLRDQEFCLIAFSRTARRLTSFTENKRELRAALDRIAVEDVPSDVADALRMAQALARTAAFDDVLLVSDGNFPPQADVELAFDLDYHRLPAAGPNIGITAFNATRTPEGGWSVFVGIEGSPDAQITADLVVSHAGKAVAEERITVADGAAERISFAVPAGKPALLKATLEPRQFDSLAADNVAWLELPASRSLWVYVAPSLGSYRHALEALATVRLFPEEGAVATEGTYDLVITDREADMGLDAPTRLCVGLVPEDLADVLSVSRDGSQVVDWRRNAPLLRHVELTDVIIMDQPRSKPGARAIDYESHGYDILVDGDTGPLLLEKRRGDQLSWWLPFHTDRSTLPYRIGFPILVSNLVEVALDRAGLARVQGVKTGILPQVGLTAGRDIRVSGPGGIERQERADEHGMVGGVPAPRVGIYEFDEGGSTRARLAASLLSPRETGLAGVKEIQFREDLAVEASSGPVRTDKALWWTLGLLAFGVLLGEWWLFQRRPGGFAR